MTDRIPYKLREGVIWDFSQDRPASGWHHNREMVEKRNAAARGRKHTPETKKKQSHAKLGKSWDEIMGPEVAEKRRQSLVEKGFVLNSRYQSTAARRWSQAIYDRDGRVCQNCLVKSDEHRVASHHIIPWEVDESLRFDPNNGLILCGRCHGKIHPGGQLPYEMRLWAYDPGGTTGFAEFVRIRFDMWCLRSWGELDLWRGITEQIRFGDQVVYENIVPRHPSFNPVGLQIIGAIRLFAEMSDVSRVYSQMNAQIHGVFKWGTYDELFKTIKSEHSKDAIAHGVVYLKKLGYTIETP